MAASQLRAQAQARQRARASKRVRTRVIVSSPQPRPLTNHWAAIHYWHRRPWVDSCCSGVARALL
eukprot:10227399-Lingulodinium_polyedra.AAC.1